MTPCLGSRGSSDNRQCYPETGAAAFAGQAHGVAAVAPGDLPHQAEAQTDAAIGFARAGSAIEWREDKLAFTLRNTRTPVADVQGNPVRRSRVQRRFDRRGSMPAG